MVDGLVDYVLEYWVGYDISSGEETNRPAQFFLAPARSSLAWTRTSLTPFSCIDTQRL